MADTVQQLRNGRFVDIVEPNRPDSPRPQCPSKAPPGSSSRAWSRYPPRTAQTRQWSRHDHLYRQPQRRPKPAPPSASVARKQVSFHGTPSTNTSISSSSSSTSIGTISCVSSIDPSHDTTTTTGPARERRRRLRLHAATTTGWRQWGGRLLPACMSTVCGGGRSTYTPTPAAGAGDTRGSMYQHAHAAVSKARLGDYKVDAPLAPLKNHTTTKTQSSTRIPAPTSPAAHAHRRRHSHGRRDADGNDDSPSRAGSERMRRSDPPRRYSLLSAVAATVLGHQPSPRPATADVGQRPRSSIQCRDEEKRRYWV